MWADKPRPARDDERFRRLYLTNVGFRHGADTQRMRIMAWLCSWDATRYVENEDLAAALGSGAWLHERREPEDG
jgi:hypothetical protein